MFFFLQKAVFSVCFMSQVLSLPTVKTKSTRNPSEWKESNFLPGSCQLLRAAGGCWRRVALTLLPRAQVDEEVAEQDWWQRRKLTKVLLWASLVRAKHWQPLVGGATAAEPLFLLHPAAPSPLTSLEIKRMKTLSEKYTIHMLHKH